MVPILLILLNMAFFALSACAVPLVKDGKPESAIILAREPNQAAQLAAFELQHHIQLITGAEVPIIHEGTEHPGTAIYVGDTEAARKQGLTPESFAKQEYEVKITDGAVFLVGRDAEDKTQVIYEPEKNVFGGLPDFFSEQGTLYAAYDFLEKEGGVRWLDATRFGTHVPKTSNLDVKTQEVRRTPSFIYRDARPSGGRRMDLYDALSGYWKLGSAELQEWRNRAHEDLRKDFPQGNAFMEALRDRYRLHLLRMRNGGEMQAANHSLTGYYKRFWDDPKTRRPEFFAKGYEGQKPLQLCYTNPELIKQVVEDARRYYDTGKSEDIFWNPEAPNLFPVVPNDNNSFCKCPTCVELIGKLPEKRVYFATGDHSDYFFNFVNEVVKGLRKTHPDKTVRTLAYMTNTAVPKRIKLDPSVAIQFCMPANRDDRPLGSYEHEMELLNQWANDGSGRSLSMWLYNCFPNAIGAQRKLNSWPGVFSHLLADQMNRFHKEGVEGFFFDGLAQDVDQYLTMRYMYDVDQDLESAMNDYFNGLYGAAAEPVKEFFKVVEERYTEMGSGLNERDVEPYTEEILSQLEGLLTKADTLAVTEQEKGNLVLLRLGIWRYLNEGMAQRERISAAIIPTLDVPKVASAGGDPSKVDWNRAVAINKWHKHDSLEPTTRKLSARVAHDDTFLYMEVTDRCDPSKLKSQGEDLSEDTWEIYVSGRRGLPFRHYSFNPEGTTRASSHGEINFRMNVAMDDIPMTVESDMSSGDQWVTRLAWPLDQIIKGGVTSSFYLNIARVAGNNPVGIWGPLSAIGECQRAPELKLEK